MDRQTLIAPPGLPLLWGVLVVLLVGMVGVWGWEGYQENTARTALPIYGMVSDFELVERSGQSFGLSDLKGRIWIVNFFFSNCTEVCPRTMPEMARLQDELADAERVRLVSITVDPEHDTLPVLAEFADHLGARPDRWYFLTGHKHAIYALSLNTFHLAVGEAPESEHTHSGNAYLHDGHFVLVDRQAQIRGYYDGLDDEALASLRQDLQSLLREKAE